MVALKIMKSIGYMQGLLDLVYKNFQELLCEDIPFTIFQQNIHRIFIEICKKLNGSSENMWKYIFLSKKLLLKLWRQVDLFVPSVNSIPKTRNSQRHYALWYGILYELSPGILDPNISRCTLR